MSIPAVFATIIQAIASSRENLSPETERNYDVSSGRF